MGPVSQSTPQQQAFNPASNPYYQQFVAQMNAAGAAQAASTRAAIQQALIAFGLVPGGFQDSMGALDDATRELIQKNTDTGISGYARMLEAKKTGITDLVNRLQAKGLRRSGARGAGLRKNQLGFDRNFADAIAALLGQTNSLYGQYAMGEAERQMALSQMLAQAYQNYYSSHNFQYPGFSPPRPPGPSPYSGVGPGGPTVRPGPSDPFWWTT